MGEIAQLVMPRLPLAPKDSSALSDHGGLCAGPPPHGAVLAEIIDAKHLAGGKGEPHTVHPEEAGQEQHRHHHEDDGAQKDSMAEVLPLFSVAARRTPQNFIAQDLGIAAPAGAGADGKLIRNSSINQLVS